jgi:hypothetical protein
MRESPSALPQPADPTWYGPQDLDVYPRALTPLRLDAFGESRDTRLLLWLRIDERGALMEVTAAEPDLPPDLVQAVRQRLAGARFAPARKDERAVKSRVQVSIGY